MADGCCIMLLLPTHHYQLHVASTHYSHLLRIAIATVLTALRLPTTASQTGPPSWSVRRHLAFGTACAGNSSAANTVSVGGATNSSMADDDDYKLEFDSGDFSCCAPQAKRRKLRAFDLTCSGNSDSQNIKQLGSTTPERLFMMPDTCYQDVSSGAEGDKMIQNLVQHFSDGIVWAFTFFTAAVSSNLHVLA
jgi:hypothetical protein